MYVRIYDRIRGVVFMSHFYVFLIYFHFSAFFCIHTSIDTVLFSYSCSYTG